MTSFPKEIVVFYLQNSLPLQKQNSVVYTKPKKLTLLMDTSMKKNQSVVPEPKNINMILHVWCPYMSLLVE